MKNKFIFLIAVFIFININYYNVKAEEFIFESTSIEITNNGNKIQARDGVKVSTKNNIEITGPDKQMVGQTAAEIRSFRRPDDF